MSENLLNTVSSLTLSIPTISTLVNAGQQTYKQYYLTAANYLLFSKSLVADSIVYVEDAVIETDQSLIPVENIKTESFPLIPDQFVQKSTSVFDNRLASIRFQKGTSTTTFTRKFNKFD